MLADSHGMRKLGQPILQPFQCSLLQRMQVRSHLLGLRVFPLAQFRNQLKQPSQPIRAFKAGAFKAGASRGPEVRSLL